MRIEKLSKAFKEIIFLSSLKRITNELALATHNQKSIQIDAVLVSDNLDISKASLYPFIFRARNYRVAIVNININSILGFEYISICNYLI